VSITRLQDWLVESLNVENLTITAATKHPAFSLLDRQRLQTWQRNFTPRLNQSPTCPYPRSNPRPTNEQPDFDEEFAKAVAEWRDKHRAARNDAVILLVELFRIHQRHWDELRRREIPSFE